MFIRIILSLLLVCSLSGQVILPMHIEDTDTTTVAVKDSLSPEELFLKEISDKALAKEEKRKKITNKVLITLVIILLVDKFTK